jgi:hypothetical protein
MANRDITGRDEFIMVEALAFAIAALGRLPLELQPANNIEDMKRLLDELVKSPRALAEAQRTARRRLTALLDGRRAVYSLIQNARVARPLMPKHGGKADIPKGRICAKTGCQRGSR